jgi:hypothetical protein
MAKNININLGSLKDFWAKLVKNLNWLFFAGFLVLLVMEFFKLQTSVSVIMGVNQAPLNTVTQKGIRINFDGYNQAVARIQQASTFTPTGGITNNPFSLTPIAPVPATPQASTTPAATSTPRR